MGSAVAVRGFARRFKNGAGVGPIDLEVDSGSVVGIVGSNGAGKTTLLRAICGLVPVTTGSIDVWGEPVTVGRSPAGLGALIETPPLFPWASARQHLLLAAAGRRSWLDRVDAALCEVDLSGKVADQRVAEYSQGMRQRLGIARVLLADPKLVILDEPTNGLDPQGIRWLRGLLKRLADDGAAVLVSSHMLAELHQVAERVIVISSGDVVADIPASLVGAHAGALDEAYFRLFG